MRLNSTRRVRLLAATAIAGGAAFAFAGAASAQDAPVSTVPGNANPPPAATGPADPREARIEQLEEQVRALAAEIDDLKSTQASGIKEIETSRQAQQAQASRPEVGLTNARPQITSANGDFKFAIRSVVQFDAADYNVKQASPAGDFASGTNFRRARLGFDATAYKDWNFSLWGEFGGSGGESSVLNQAFIEYAGFKPFKFADPLRIRVGAWATPAGLEDATPNTEMLFLERAAVEEMVRGLDAGDGRESAGVFLTGKRWYFSGVLTSRVAGAATPPVYSQQSGFLTRVAFNPLHGKDYDVHVGGAIQGVISPLNTGAAGFGARTLSLSQQPELRVDGNGTKLVSTGAIDASGMTTYSAEAGGSFHNFYLAGEYYKLDVDRTALSSGAASPFDPSFSGWYVQGAWTLTGERHVWSSANGGFRGIFQPFHNFNPAAGNWGAWEIAARYSVLDLNDDPGVFGHTAPTGGIRGGEQKITSVALDWYPNSVLRFIFEYQNGSVDRLTSAGGDMNAHLNNFSIRSQFAF